MTNHDAATSICNIIQMMLTIGLPLCMVAGWRDAGAKQKTNTKKTTTRRAKRGRRPSAVTGDLVKDRRMKAKAESRPLSEFENRLLADYFVKRNFATA